MLNQLLLFTTSIALGMVLGALYVLCSIIAQSTRLKAMVYIFDVVWCGIAFTAFAALSFFMGGGLFQTFTLLGLLAGLGISSLLFARAKNKFVSKKRLKKRQSAPQ